MAQYLLAVHHAPGLQHSGTGASASEEDMQSAFAAVGEFNTGLSGSGALVFACGLTDPADAVTVDGTGAEPASEPGPLPRADVHISGFWVVEAPDDAAAAELGTRASQACGNRVEVRRLQG